MTFLLSNWRYVLIGVLLASNALFWNLWQSKSEELMLFKAQVQVLGEEAKRKAKETEAKQEQIRKDVNDEWNKKLPEIRKDAVDAFKRKYSGSGLRPNPGSSGLSSTTISPQRTDGELKEPVANSDNSCPTEFIQDTAEDVLKLNLWQKWARENRIPVK